MFCGEKSFEIVPDCEIFCYSRNIIIYIGTALSPRRPVDGWLLSTDAVLCRSEGLRGRKAARIRTQDTGQRKGTECLVLLVINLLRLGSPHAFFFHSIHTLH